MKIKLTLSLIVFFLSILTFYLPLAVYAQHGSVLLIDDHPGIEEVDAQSAAMLVAAEFRKLGISVGDPVYKARNTGVIYRITFRSLGDKILVHLSQENPPDTIVIERKLWIDSIEEIIKAAPRLVDALVNNKPIETTVDMETVTGHEAAKLNKITGESLWNIGIFGTIIPGTDVVGEPGWEFGWSYETPKYAVGTEFRHSGDEEFTFFSWSIGGRYFFNNKNISPYVGGGFSIFNGSYTTITQEREKRWFSDEWDYYDYHDTEDDNGLATYVVGGLEMLRLTKSRLRLELRVDRPFFSLPSQDMMPITFGIFFSQHYVPGRSGCSLF